MGLRRDGCGEWTAGPGRLDDVTLKEYRAKIRVQELVFDLARGLTKQYVVQPKCQVPAHVLFPQLVTIIDKYLREKVFVPFFTTKRQGSGVGLTLVRQIATVHGGTVGLSDTEGGGTTVSIRL